MNEIIQIQHLQKHFGNLKVLNDVSFDIHKGEVVTVIGSSGSGKSTMLRCINLLERMDGGNILYHGKNILDNGNDVNQYRSKVGMVFQSFNLFNNLSVIENCMIGQIKVLKRSKEEARAKAEKVVKIIKIWYTYRDIFFFIFIWILKDTSPPISKRAIFRRTKFMPCSRCRPTRKRATSLCLASNSQRRCARPPLSSRRNLKARTLRTTNSFQRCPRSTAI